MSIEIHVRQLTKKFGNTEALRSFSTIFEPNALHGVIGPEGAGKTTLFRLINGLLKPFSGGVTFETTDGQKESEKYIKSSSGLNQKVILKWEQVQSQIAYMPQQQSLYSDLSIREHLDFFRTLYGLQDEVYYKRSDELLNLTRLKEFEDRLAGKLSGGMYKKLGLICALLRAPEIILLDEPTNGVDPISRREFWDLLYSLKTQKIIIIVATSYMDEAERCHLVHLMQEGQLIEKGGPREILEKRKVRNLDELFLKWGTTL